MQNPAIREIRRVMEDTMRESFRKLEDELSKVDALAEDGNPDRVAKLKKDLEIAENDASSADEGWRMTEEDLEDRNELVARTLAAMDGLCEAGRLPAELDDLRMEMWKLTEKPPRTF